MARAAVLGRLSWRAAQVRQVRDESATARTLVLEVPSWPGHLPGQHVDVRLTAEDGYSTQRSYSIASAPDGARVELTVERLEDGEVSPYLTDVLQPGDPLELRGPIGGWFVWRRERRRAADGHDPHSHRPRQRHADAPDLLDPRARHAAVPRGAATPQRPGPGAAGGPRLPPPRPGGLGRQGRQARGDPARRPGLAARRPARQLRLRPDQLRRGRRQPAHRPGPRSAADQDRTVRAQR